MGDPRFDNDIDWDNWHGLMQAGGWLPQRDVFGTIVQYQYPRAHGSPLVLNSSEFAMWAGLEQTPPPF